MLLFSALLEINDTLTQDSFIRLVLDWNKGAQYEENIIRGISWNGERNVKYGTDKLWLDIEEYRNQNIIAVRYEKVGSDGIIWDSDYIMNFNSMQMSIQLDRSFAPDALTTEKEFSSPYFIKLLIDSGYIRDDDDLPISDLPLEIDDSNINILADVINGKTDYKLPVIYISKTYNDDNPVDARDLAYKLKGVAHVLVQQSNYTNSILRKICNDQNEYYGAVGIYFSTPSHEHKKFLYRAHDGVDKKLFNRVVKEVYQRHNVQHLDPLFTWNGVSNALLTDRLKSQKEERAAAETARRKALYKLLLQKKDYEEKEESIYQDAENKAKEEADKILDSFEEEMRISQKQIENLKNDNERLQSENRGLNAKLDELGNMPLLYMGEEMDFFPGEIKDIVLSVLSDVSFDEQKHSRRADVLKDIIEHNNYESICKKRSVDVKKILKNFGGMNPRLRQKLENIGFTITEEGKHYKLCYYGDERYRVTLSKTPGDKREGKNSASEIIYVAL